MAKGDLNGNESAKGRGFDGNPDNINKSGANRKSFSAINETLKARGVEPLKKTQFVEAYTLIFNSTEEELKELAEDKEVPMVLRLIIMELSNKKTRAKALADYRDYMFGKALQQQEIIVPKNIKSITLNVVRKEPKPEEEVQEQETTDENETQE